MKKSQNAEPIKLHPLLRKVLILIAFVFSLLGLYLLAYQYEGVFYVGALQAAVDQQCGEGQVEIQWQKIYTDPHLGWSDEGFSCNKVTGTLVCLCGE